MSKEEVHLPIGLVDLIKGTPVYRRVAHCNTSFEVPFFDIYADCPKCNARVKVRSLSACEDVEDVFDAVFQWSLKPGAAEVMKKRVQEIADDMNG